MGYFGMSRSYFYGLMFIIDRYAHDTPDIVYDIDTTSNIPTLLQYIIVIKRLLLRYFTYLI